MSQEKPWFEEWFDSPYYHILYGHRDQNEASAFIQSLIQYIQPKSDAVFLDLACGKGRHSLQINKMGFEVYGVDLSKDSINHASQFETDTLHFIQGDMRDVLRPNTFDYVFNLFTSFGYFDDSEEDLKVLRAVHEQLKPGGTFVIDYLNFEKIRDQFPYKGSVTKQGIEFKIEKKIVESGSKWIQKTISFTDQGQDFNFAEKVRIIGLDELVNMLEKAGFKAQTFWGDYGLNPYHAPISDRMIILAKKAG